MGTSFLDQYKSICERDGLTPFRPVLPKLSKEYLEVNLDVIPENELLALLRAMAVNDTLISIKLETNFLKDNPQLTTDLYKLHTHQESHLPAYMKPKTMDFFCSSLKAHTSRNELNLKILRINGLPLTELQLSIIAGGLRGSKALHLLSLQGIPLSARHLGVFLPAICHLQSLAILNFSSCCLGCNEVSILCRFIRGGHTVERLTLNGNPIGDTGVEQLVKSLGSYSHIRALDLQNCGLSSRACFYLQELLEKNIAMEVCDIRRNTAVSREAALRIAKALIENNHFRQSSCAYRPLPIDMSPHVDAQDAMPRDIPQKSFCNTPLGANHQTVINYSKSDQQPVASVPHSHRTQSTPPRSSEDQTCVCISKTLLAQWQASLLKFQFLLNHLESQNLIRFNDAINDCNKSIDEDEPLQTSAPSGAKGSAVKQPNLESDRIATKSSKVPQQQYYESIKGIGSTTSKTTTAMSSSQNIEHSHQSRSRFVESQQGTKSSSHSAEISYTDTFTYSSAPKTAELGKPSASSSNCENHNKSSVSDSLSDSEMLSLSMASTVKKISPQRQHKGKHIVDTIDREHILTSPKSANDIDKSLDYKREDADDRDLQIIDDAPSHTDNAISNVHNSPNSATSPKAPDELLGHTSDRLDSHTNISELKNKLDCIKSTYVSSVLNPEKENQPVQRSNLEYTSKYPAISPSNRMKSQRQTTADQASTFNSYSVDSFRQVGSLHQDSDVSDISIETSYSGELTGSDLDKF